MDIPQLLDPSDVSKGITDERSVMTYVSMIRRAYEQKDNGGLYKMTPSIGEVKERVATEGREGEDNQIEGLKQENHRLTQEVASLRESVSTLTQENESLKNTNRTLKAQIETEMGDESSGEETHLIPTTQRADIAVFNPTQDDSRSVVQEEASVDGTEDTEEDSDTESRTVEVTQIDESEPSLPDLDTIEERKVVVEAKQPQAEAKPEAKEPEKEVTKRIEEPVTEEPKKVEKPKKAMPVPMIVVDDFQEPEVATPEVTTAPEDVAEPVSRDISPAPVDTVNEEEEPETEKLKSLGEEGEDPETKGKMDKKIKKQSRITIQII